MKVPVDILLDNDIKHKFWQAVNVRRDVIV